MNPWGIWSGRLLLTAAALSTSLVATDARQLPEGERGEGPVTPAAVDPLLDQQWHLKARSIEPAGATIVPAWAVGKGTGVVIGIVGDGLQGTHPDLQANYLPSASFDFNSNDADPTPDASHTRGTAAAGVNAARDDNGIGGAGVAPRASIAGLRLTGAAATDQQEANAFAYLPDTIHLQSHAWNRNDGGSELSKPGPLAAAALQSAATTARGGKGRIFVFGAGDGRTNSDNCNFDGYANSRFAIAVGALTDAGEQASYSEFCSALLVSAPSNGGSRGLTTTDLSGAPGSDPGDYTSAYGGTAGAAAVTSGVVALMLERNPTLTWRDVQHILRRSSFRINPGDASWTAGPLPHSERYGFGLVDAEAAANMATTWANVPAESVIAPPGRTLNVAIPDNDPDNGVTDSIVVSGAPAGFLVEHIEVEFTATHAWRGDLQVTLTSPTGVVSTLAARRPSDNGANFSAWRFSTVRHWGDSADGTWTLRVSDGVQFITGNWVSWSMRVYGSGTPAPTVSTGTATNVGLTTATVNGTINPNGASTAGVFEYGFSIAYGNSIPTSSPGAGGSPVAVSASLSGLACGTLYHFRVVGTNAAGTSTGSDSTFTTGTCPPSSTGFTDDPLVLTSTRVKAVHITELRQRINAARTRCGLAVFSWTDPTLSPTSTIIRAVHLVELRTALLQAYSACQRTPPSFTDPTITPQVTAAKGVHIAELRTAVIALE